MYDIWIFVCHVCFVLLFRRCLKAPNESNQVRMWPMQHIAAIFDGNRETDQQHENATLTLN